MSERETTAPAIPRLRPADLRAAFASAEHWLAVNRDGINAINVYPVPDGDTGTNMLLTLRAALRGVDDLPPTVGETAGRLARAALLGARGNSGVILSQMLRGFAEALGGCDDTSGPQMIHALCNASDVAYASVSQPVEGTMLTVLREAATLARESIAREAGEAAVLHALIDQAYASVERTPELLPRLKEAGVVDAGGAGIAVILEGVVASIHGIPLSDAPRYRATERVALDGVEHEGHGYCTEFLVTGDAIDLRAIEQALLDLGGESLLVVGDPRTVHVHVHVEDPGPALSVGARAGALGGVKVENMQAQHEEWMAERGGAEEPVTAVPIGLVTIARGAGIVDAFRGLGATIVISPAGGKTSAGEILEAARRAGSEHAILLPNDKDIFMAAEAAASEAEGFLTVVPSANVAAGLAAAIGYRSTGDVDTIVAEMTDALDAARCVEVSTAVRDATVDGVSVRGGDAIAFIDGRLRRCGTTHEAVLLAALEDAVQDGAEIVTVYLGSDAPDDAADRIESAIAEAYPELEVEVLDGGQPHYPYIASVE
ncbi:MAG: DAK2 domain-containing protein [Dehalococcoidia bacterium]